MSTNYTNEVTVKSYDDRTGAFIEVSPELEIGSIRVKTGDDKSSEWYGKIDFSINVEAARDLIQAIQLVIDLNKWD